MVQDLHSVYGIDLDDEQVWKTRTWIWLKTRILGLLNADTRLQRHLTPDEQQ